MALFVGFDGAEVYSKKCYYQSGRPDLNRRPLDPQSRSGRRWAWLSVAQWALDQARQSPGVAGRRLKSACVGSWFGSFAGWSAARRPDSRETVNNARRAAVRRGDLVVDMASLTAPERSFCASPTVRLEAARARRIRPVGPRSCGEERTCRRSCGRITRCSAPPAVPTVPTRPAWNGGVIPRHYAI